MFSKKKGQISIEALILVGVLVIGGVIFASVYLNNLGVHTKRSSELSGLTDGFMNDLSGWNDTPGTPDTPTVNCIIDGVCQDPPENTNNCSDCVIPPSGCNNNGYCEASLGEDATNCPDCQYPVFSNFTLNKYVPSGDSAINSKFSLKAQINSSYPSVEIYDIKLEKYIIADSSWDLSSKCTIKGAAPDTATGIYPGTLIMTIEDVSLKNQGKIIDEITCSEEGEYKFSAKARPKGVTGIGSLSDDENKTITATPTGCAVPGVCGLLDSCPNCPECCLNLTPKFSISIISPTEGQAYFNNQSIQLTAQDADTLSRTGVICEWYIGEKYIPASKSCDYSFNLSTIDPGTTKVTVYATKEVNGVTLSSKGERNIKIYKSDPTAIYLSSPGIQYVGKEFNLKVSSQNQSLVSGVSNTNITFSGTTCIIDNARVSGVLTEEVGTTNVYYKTFPTTCNQASYSAPETLSPVNAIFSGATTPFYVGYDTSLDFGACSENGSNYGQLTSCVLATAGGNYNSDYWNNSSYGLLKVTVDVASGETTNDYGTLTVYVE